MLEGDREEGEVRHNLMRGGDNGGDGGDKDADGGGCDGQGDRVIRMCSYSYDIKCIK